MPRSTKASSRASTASKRTSKRNTSVQRDVYAIPESPESPVASEADDTSRTIRNDESVSGRPSSPAPSNLGRSMSVTSTKIGEDLDSTPTQAKKPRSRALSIELKQPQVPGLEALEAVNVLYQKLKDSSAEVAQLKQENEKLVGELQSCEQELQSMRTELHVEKEKLKKAQGKDNLNARRAEDDLGVVLGTLKNFSSAAYNLMPLLDVLSDAPDIRYDEDTEKLFQLMKQYRERKRDYNNIKAKSEPVPRPD